MQVFYSFDSFPTAFCGGAVSIGKFDGVHLGHSAILKLLKRSADQRGIPAVAMTFDPPPIAVLRPDLNCRPICTLPRKIELIQKFGIDAMFVLKTNEQLLWQAAETFFTETLKEKLSAKILIEGSNFSFGWKRSGNAEFLCRTGQQAGIEIELVEPIEQDGNPVSSSIVRRLLQNGNVENANRLLTEPYQLTGTVAVGQQRGRTLGFPTANLEDVETIIPLGGVYASAVNIGGQQHLATTHIGSNITFGQAEPTIESFIHNFTGDLYGKQLNVVLHSRIRGSQKFDSVDELVAQMEKDVESTSCRC